MKNPKHLPIYEKPTHYTVTGIPENTQVWEQHDGVVISLADETVITVKYKGGK